MHVYPLLWLAAISTSLQAPLSAVTMPGDTLPGAEGGATAQLPAPGRPGPVVTPSFPSVVAALPSTDTGGSGRPKAFEYSHAYEVRLTIHKYASYTTLPLFAAEYYLGQKLYNADSASLRTMHGTRNAHQVVATAIEGLFAVNTVTGVWNLWEGRKDPNGRTRRFIHGALMILSDAGFVATASTAPGGREAENNPSGFQSSANRHRGLAIASFSTALVGDLMMLIWK